MSMNSYAAGVLPSDDAAVIKKCLVAAGYARVYMGETRGTLHCHVAEAVDSAGLSVTWLRYRGVLIAGALCGVAGAYLSIAHGGGFVREMSAGKGFIALAAMIFGKWRPGTVLAAALIFGFLEAAAARLQSVELPVVGVIPVELILVLPYVATVVLLAGFFGRAVPPKALGVAYVKER